MAAWPQGQIKTLLFFDQVRRRSCRRKRSKTLSFLKIKLVEHNSIIFQKKTKFRDRIKGLKLRRFDTYLGGAAVDEASQ